MAPNSTTQTQTQQQAPISHEIRNMVSTLTHHLNSSSNQEQGHGNGIITLAGTNRGATMKSDMEHEVLDTHGVVFGDEQRLSAYTNSNYQSINNSIVLGGSYTAEDPGIHLVISDYLEEHEHEHEHEDDDDDDEDEDEDHEKNAKKESKKKKKKKEKKGKKEKKKDSSSDEE
ncbi:hypothetical protein IHE45_11G008500 [Dioscorea alata]|uniref:Uncharacterized protein n=1 Tax=Dioscorea alata TaxID=55571 RepID=A0ACB7V4A2_DIOAL|nr:hypothetical protein IHE45_11G008500 [Dioscorea alata]